jgi:hypothetical protein
MTSTDQGLVRTIIAQLPFFIEHIKTGSRTINRNWHDWVSLAESIHSTLLTCTESLVPEIDEQGQVYDATEVSVVAYKPARAKQLAKSPTKKPITRKPSGKTARVVSAI